MPDKFIVSQVVLQKAVDYLITRPYQEVAVIIANIQRDIKPLEETEKPAANPE